MTGFPIPVNPLGEHHRHAAVKTGAHLREPKHAEPQRVSRVVLTRRLGASLLAVAATVAVISMLAVWAPMRGATPVVSEGSDTALNQGIAAGAEMPTLAPSDRGDGPSAGSADLDKTAVEIAAARTFAGSQLASNVGLTLSAPARELLVGGQVDARGILSLGQYLGQTHLTVADFPASDTATEAGGVRRQILVSGLAGVPLGTDASALESVAPDSVAPDSEASDGAAAAASVTAWFQALSAPANVESVSRTPAGVLVTFAPGEPSSLLPSPAPSL